MTASDLVSIMTFANALEVKQDFTADRDLLTQTIRSFQIGAGSDLSLVAATGDDTTGRGHGGCVRARRDRVQHLQYGHETGRAGIGGQDAGEPAREKGAGVFLERRKQDRCGEPVAAPFHDQRRGACQRGVLPDRCPRADRRSCREATPAMPRPAGPACSPARRRASSAPG